MKSETNIIKDEKIVQEKKDEVAIENINKWLDLGLGYLIVLFFCSIGAFYLGLLGAIPIHHSEKNIYWGSFKSFIVGMIGWLSIYVFPFVLGIASYQRFDEIIRSITAIVIFPLPAWMIFLVFSIINGIYLAAGYVFLDSTIGLFQAKDD